MKIPHHPPTTRGMLIALTASLLIPTVSRADDYLQRNQTQGWNWNTVNAGTGWFPAAKGGNAASELSPDGTYHTNGFQLRTKEINSHDPMDRFLGGELILDCSSDGETAGSLTLKDQGEGVARVEKLAACSGIIYTGSGSSPQNLQIGTLKQKGTTRFIANASGRGYNLTIGKLTGTGSLNFEEQHVSDHSTSFNVGITDALDFKGNVTFTGGTATFAADLKAPGTTLILRAGTTFDLNGKTLTLSSLILGDTTLSAGAYPAANLKNHNVSVIGNGTVIVRPAH